MSEMMRVWIIAAAIALAFYTISFVDKTIEAEWVGRNPVHESAP